MSELEEQIQNRRDKRAALLAAGIAPYPARYPYDQEPSAVHEEFGEMTPEELEAAGARRTVPGRLRALRKHGKIYFLDLYDGRTKLQVLVRQNKLEEDAVTVLQSLDLGDYVGATGPILRSKTGELTLFAEDVVLLSKALRPLPEKWHGLTEVESRYRQRYLDLLVNPESRRVFEVRAAIIRCLRSFLERHGFLEVETPMMHSIAGGATARPFVTHHNALDLELYMRIAPELFLKRLIVGGLHRVYEINRNFRNEGVSTRHNPEFTMLEFYWAYSDYEQLVDFTEEMLSTVADEVLGAPVLPWQGKELSLARPWARYTMRGAIAHFAEIPEAQLETAEQITAHLRERKLPLPPARTYGHLLMTLFEETVEEHLHQPTFITDHPVEVSPLAKQRTDDPRFTERFELYLGGMEIANAFSELNDPEVQADRFHQQLEAKASGDAEAHVFDQDYIQALEHGMPPTGGEGVGIDRLTMLFTDRASIRDVILFPLLRPQAQRREISEATAAGDGPATES